MVTLSEVDLAVFALLWADDTNKVIALELGISHLLGQLITRVVNVHTVVIQDQRVVDLIRKLLRLLTDGNELNLPRRQPEIPLTTRLLTQNSNKPLK